MRIFRHAALILSLAAPAAFSAEVTTEEPAKAQPNWQEQYAYTLGVQAYVFGSPYVYLSSLRWSWVTQPPKAGAFKPYAPLNHFFTGHDLPDASYRGGGSPNNDTLYSIAWVDVTKEPVILSHPEMGDRYFTFEMAGIESDNFAYVGTRTTGESAGSFAIIGPHWKGELPKGVKALPPSLTNSVLIFGRTFVADQADVPAVNALQDQYSLIPLSLWGKKDAVLPESRDVWKPFDTKTDPLAEWKTMNRAMTENPPEQRLAKLVELFGKIGVGPGQDIDKLDESSKRGLARAAVDGKALLNEAIRSGDLGKRVNGWNIPPSDIGSGGLSDDFLTRSTLQNLGGIITNEPAEAVYFNTTLDSKGQTLDGAKRYSLHFLPGQLPQVKAFWSITMYDLTYNLVPNPKDRYALRDRSPDLKYDTDGGLTLYIQSESPGQDKEANWLPSPKSGPFFVVLRTYLPGAKIIEQKWAPPALELTP